MKSKLTSSLFALLIGVLLAPAVTQAEVWKTTRAWDNKAELEFAKYIKALPLDYFLRDDHPWGRITTDCADAAYTLRVIFAFNNGLPVSFGTWQGAKTNAMTEFDDIQDPIKRVRKFIAHVNTYTNTETLSADTYPIAIRPGVLRPGVIFLHVQGDKNVPLTYRAGHVYYLQNVGENGIIRYISSTVPAEIRKLGYRNGINFAPMTADGGYRAWKWPDSNERPYQSDEQFQLASWYPNSYRDAETWYRWQRAIAKQVALRPSTAKERLEAQFENLQNTISERVTAVNSGWAFYQSKYAGQGCMTENDYHNYSTPTRDVKAQVELQNFQLAAKAYVREAGNPTDDSYMSRYYQKFQFRISKDRIIDVNDLREGFLTETTLQVSEPEHSPEVRWGLRRISINQWRCPERMKSYVVGETQ